MDIYCSTFAGGYCKILNRHVEKKFCTFCKNNLRLKCNIIEKDRKERSRTDINGIIAICLNCNNMKVKEGQMRCGTGCCGKFIDILVKWEDLHCPQGKW